MSFTSPLDQNNLDDEYEQLPQPELTPIRMNNKAKSLTDKVKQTLVGKNGDDEENNYTRCISDEHSLNKP